MQRFGSWLEIARRFQRDTYGTEIAQLSNKEWAEYVRWNFLAAHTELSEALQHLQWKPWRGGEKRTVGTDRDLAVREMVDVLFFVSNILNALGVTDEELEREYSVKQSINSRRQEDEQKVVEVL